MTIYTPRQLLAKVHKLPVSTRFADTIQPPASYASHKDHWIGWLSEYDGPGYYGRKRWDRDARFVYNYLNCAPMIIWINEAAGRPTDLIERAAIRHCARLDRASATRAASVRELLPWESLVPFLWP